MRTGTTEIIRQDRSLMIREEAGRADSYERMMFLTCRIEGLIPAKSAWLGEERVLVYLTDECQPLTGTEADAEDVRAALDSLYRRLPMYLLREDRLILELPYVLRKKTGEIGFLYCPGQPSGLARKEAEERFFDELAKRGHDSAARSGQDTGRAGRRGSQAEENWETYREYARPHEESPDAENGRALTDGGRSGRDKAFIHTDDRSGEPRKRQPLIDRYTILTTLFLVSVVLVVFMILQTGILDQILDFFTEAFAWAEPDYSPMTVLPSDGICERMEMMRWL